MNERAPRSGFATRPVDAEQWIKAADTPQRQVAASDFTARLTVDITPELRGRIKIVAFQRGVTVADMLRALLEREFPPTDGATS
jgi:hypothetical protein